MKIKALKIKALVGNCVKCGAPIYDMVTVQRDDRTAQSFLDYEGKPEPSCFCLDKTLKPVLRK